MKKRLKNIALFIGLGLLCGSPSLAEAKYPEKPIKLVVPYTPAGAADQLARELANNLGKNLNQSIVVENKPGASTRVGAMTVARSAPDGYTLFMASNSSMVLNPLLYKDFPYDPERDFEVVAIVAEMPLVVITNNQTNFNKLDDLVSVAKKNPEKLNYASIGNGNPLQLATELLLSEYDIKVTHIPFNGSSPALTSLMSNETQLMVDGISTSMPLIRGDKIKALAVTTSQRLNVLPDTPTVAEISGSNYQASTWFGIAVPKGTPKEAIDKLQGVINITLKNQEFQDKFAQLGLVVLQPKTLTDINKFLIEDRVRWQEVIQKNNISLD